MVSHAVWKHGPRASVTTKTSAFGLGFCLLIPSGHVFSHGMGDYDQILWYKLICIYMYTYIYIQGWSEVCAQPTRDGVTALLCNDVSHWLVVASLESALCVALGADGLKPTRLAGHWFRYHHWDINIISNTRKMFPNRLVVGKRTGL